MKTALPLFLKSAKSYLCCSVLGLLPFTLTAVRAATVPTVQMDYVSNIHNVDINMPVTGTTVDVRPTSLGVYGESLALSGPTTVGLRVEAINPPAGFEVKMLSYVSLSTSSLQFSPTEVFDDNTAESARVFKPFTVTVTIPSADIPRDGVARLFAYKVFSDWPVDANRVVRDTGYALNATVTAARPPTGAPPTVLILTPSQPTYGPYALGSVPSTIPLQFTASSAATTTITAVDATINGYPISIPPVNTPGSVDGLNTPTTTVTVPMPISGQGTYTVVVRGTDGNTQSVSATTTFTVVVSGLPPTVAVTAPANNSDYTYFIGGPAVSVPSAFRATSPVGTELTSLTGSLTIPGGELRPLTITTVDSSNPTMKIWNGTSPIDLLSDSGKYTLRAKATNNFSNDAEPNSFATATVDFWINRVTSPAPQSVNAFSDPTFSVSLTEGVPGVSYIYRWQRKPVNSSSWEELSVPGPYSGINTSSLTVTSARGNMNGDQFRCLVGSSPATMMPSPAATLTVRQLPVTVTADSFTRSYGGLNPALTYQSSGFVGNDSLTTASGITGSVAMSTGATQASSAGTYAINAAVDSLRAENYYFVSQPGLMTVTPLARTVTAEAKTKVYGQTDPQLTYTLDTPLLFNGALAGALTRSGGETKGTYAISQGSLNGAPNYTLTFSGANLVISAKPVDATATFSKVYDGNVSWSSATGNVLSSVSGVIPTDSQNVSLSLSGVGVTFSDANVANGKSVTLSGTAPALTGTAAGNYLLNPVSASGNITQAPQKITFGTLGSVAVGASITLSATGGPSGNLVTFAVSYPATNAATVTIVGNTVRAVSAGTVIFTANQAGNTNYAAATPISQTLTVTSGSTTPTCGTAIVRHAPVLNGNSGVAGSLQVLLPESIALNGNAWISKNLYVPGTPTLRVNGRPTYGSTIEGTGAPSPTNHTVTLNGNNVLGHLVRRTDAVAMPVIPVPPAATGTRDVRLNKPSDSAGSFATVRDLTVSGTAASVAVPPGIYRDITVTGTSSVVLGVANATVPAVYHVRNLKFTGNSQLKVVGPIILTVGDDAVFNDKVGNSAHPEWLKLNLFSGDLTLNGTVSLYGHVVAPAGEVKIDGQGKLRGGLICDKLTMNGYGLVDLCNGSGQGSNSNGVCRDEDDDDDDDDDHHDGEDDDDDGDDDDDDHRRSGRSGSSD